MCASSVVGVGLMKGLLFVEQWRQGGFLPSPFLSISGKWARLKSIIRWVKYVEISWLGLRWISGNVCIKLTMKQVSPPVNVWLQKNYQSASCSLSAFLLRKLGEVPLGFRCQEFTVSENSKWGANRGQVLQALGTGRVLTACGYVKPVGQGLPAVQLGFVSVCGAGLETKLHIVTYSSPRKVLLLFVFRYSSEGEILGFTTAKNFRMS